jgi:predicted permease
VGQELSLNGQGFTVVGVMPRGFTGVTVPFSVDVWVPLGAQALVMPGSASWMENRRTEWLAVTGRLRPGIPRGQAASEIRSLEKELLQEHPSPEPESPLELMEIRGLFLPFMRRLAGAATLMLQVVVALVLLLACANVANLHLARSEARRREMAIRLALGASRARVIRQLLIESLLLAGAGASAGLLAAAWVNPLLPAFLPSAAGPWKLAPDLGVDGRVIAFTVLLAVATVLILGLVPALRASRPVLSPLLASDAAYGRSRRLGLGGGIVVAQVALSLLLLLTTGLFVQSWRQAQGIDLGFETHRALTASLDLSLSGYDDAGAKSFYGTLVERLEALCGVEVVSLASRIPLDGRNSTLDLRLDDAHDPLTVELAIVDDRYFAALGIPLVLGRPFERGDRAGSPPVVIVNETSARRFWQAENPLGKMKLPVGRASPPGSSAWPGTAATARWEKHRGLLFTRRSGKPTGPDGGFPRSE